MPTDDLARTALLGVLAALVAFEFIVAVASWLSARSRGAAIADELWLSGPTEIRRHLTARRREFDAVRRQYPVLRSPRHGHEIRNAIRHLAGPRYPHLAVRQPATRPLLPGT